MPGESKECCYWTPVLKNSGQRVGICSFMLGADKKYVNVTQSEKRKYGGIYDYSGTDQP